MGVSPEFRAFVIETAREAADFDGDEVELANGYPAGGSHEPLFRDPLVHQRFTPWERPAESNKPSP